VRRTRLRFVKATEVTATVAIVVSCGLMLAAALTGPMAPRSGAGHAGDEPAQTQGPGSLFRIRGHVKGMYPGRHRRLVVHISNPQGRAIVVTSIIARVGRAVRGCKGSNVRVRRFSGAKRVPAWGRAKVRLRVRMLSTAPDACKDVRFPVVFSGAGHGA
jgi:hypothetical protein